MEKEREWKKWKKGKAKGEKRRGWIGVNSHELGLAESDKSQFSQFSQSAASLFCRYISIYQWNIVH